MTKNQEELFTKTLKENLEKAKIAGMRDGAVGILGAVLEMCNQGKTVDDVKQFCVTSLNLKGMQIK